MQDMNDEDRKAVLGEVLMDEFKAIREYLEDISKMRPTLNEIDGRLISVESDVKVIKAAATDQSKQLQDHESQLLKLIKKTA